MIDNGNWSEQYSMENIIGCEYNMDNGYVEVYYSDGNILQLKCEEIEANLHTTEQSLTKLYELLNDKPIEYVAMALSGELQAYCDIEADIVSCAQNHPLFPATVLILHTADVPYFYRNQYPLPVL